MTDHQTLRIEAAALALNDLLCGLMIMGMGGEQHAKQLKKGVIAFMPSASLLLQITEKALEAADAVKRPADVNDTNAANTGQVMSADQFRDELHTLFDELYGDEDSNHKVIRQSVLLRIKQRDAAITAELVDGLKCLWQWSHWANEKLGFGDEPKFPEYIKARELIQKYGVPK